VPQAEMMLGIIFAWTGGRNAGRIQWKIKRRPDQPAQLKKSINHSQKSKYGKKWSLSDCRLFTYQAVEN
jgi:hypothetical protein